MSRPDRYDVFSLILPPLPVPSPPAATPSSAAWLCQHPPGAPVLLITDPWQLPRATRAFVRQGLQVHPLAAEPPLTAPERNRLALRKLAATVFIGCRDGCEGQRLLMQPCTRWAAGAYACTMIYC